MLQNTVEIKAYAKVNLCLDITGIADNGWHYLDTIVAPIPLHDIVTVTKREDDLIRVTYDNGNAFPNDVAVKMAKTIKNTFGTHGVDINIKKKIPIASGIGGSSADAVAVAKGMKKVFSLGNIDNSILKSVGSDVPAMYKGGINRVRGFGEIVESVSLPNSLYVSLLIDDTTPLKTEEIYKLYDKTGGEHGVVDDFLVNLKPFNSLEKAAISINPKIIKLKDLLYSAGYEFVVMTGSGSGVIGFTTDKDEYSVITKKVTKSLHNDNVNHYAFIIDKKGVWQ